MAPYEFSYFRRFDWGVTVVCTVIAFLPLFIYGRALARGQPVGYWSSLSVTGNLHNDDYAYYNTPVYESRFRELNILFLGVSLAPLADVLLDLYNVWRKGGTTASPDGPDTIESRSERKIVRMHAAEKLCFLVGMMLQSSFVLFPTAFGNCLILFLIQNATSEVNTVLTFVPVLFFLQRTTDVFTPLLTTVLCLLVNVASAAKSCCYMVPVDTITYQRMDLASTVLFLLTFSVFVAAILLSFARHVKEHWLHGGGFRIVEEGAAGSNDFGSRQFAYFSQVIVPGWHAGALTVLVLVDIAWYALPDSILLPEWEFSTLLGAQLGATVLVLLIDMRVRNAEISHNLETLDSKRDFVRFLSHEIRTPLSTASMGLEIVAEELSIDGADASDKGDAGETLSLIQQSVFVAVEIFDQLLSYDSIENQNQQALSTACFTACRFFRTVIDPLHLQVGGWVGGRVSEWVGGWVGGWVCPLWAMPQLTRNSRLLLHAHAKRAGVQAKRAGVAMTCNMWYELANASTKVR